MSFFNRGLHEIAAPPKSSQLDEPSKLRDKPNLKAKSKAKHAKADVVFEFVGPSEPPKSCPEESFDDQAERFNVGFEDAPHLKFKDIDVLRETARRKGWVPFTNELSGERGFWIPEVPDSVVYASWERGLSFLPRADIWLRESGKPIPVALEARLREQDDENAEHREGRQETALREAAEETLRLQQIAEEQEAARRRAEEETRRLQQIANQQEAARRQAEEETRRLQQIANQQEAARRRAEEETRRLQIAEEQEAAKRRVEDEIRRQNKHAEREAEEAAAAELRRQRERSERLDRERAEAEAAAKLEKRRLEALRFLRKNHGKQAFAYLAHEGALDRQVWDRPDDDAKRLGECDSHHVASGGTHNGAVKPDNYVHALEEAVRHRHPSLKEVYKASADAAGTSSHQSFVMHGWLDKRGPMHTHKWVPVWCVLKEGSLTYHSDETCHIVKGITSILRVSRAIAFSKHGAPGDAVKHRREKPFGFVLDVDRDLGVNRRLLYFDATTSDKLAAWLNAFAMVCSNACGDSSSIV
eukprot:TRINITY_DN31982_c0_g1_i1.p1 TRINITY_DN31982_c0_g1~~TRINITY_DN31982_c0_g1_i1.p1  ORF type:complete len:529 (+),score=101.67 TRINITY_DN31982_c0_g1_i1:203-1789(+)